METAVERTQLLVSAGITLDPPDALLNGPFFDWAEWVLFTLITAKNWAGVAAFAGNMAPHIERITRPKKPAFALCPQRVYHSVVATAVAKDPIEFATQLVRRKDCHICYTIYHILDSKPGVLEPSPLLDLFLAVYVGKDFAAGYAMRILCTMKLPALALPFMSLFRACMRPYDVAMLVGICDAPVVCAACRASPGACRLYGLVPQMSNQEKFDIAVKFGLTKMVVPLIPIIRPLNDYIFTLIVNLMHQGTKCSFNIAQPLRELLDDLQAANQNFDELRLAVRMVNNTVIRTCEDYERLVDVLRVLSQRPSWRYDDVHAEAVHKLRTYHKPSNVRTALTDYLLPFLASLNVVSTGETHLPSSSAQAAERVLHRIDTEHTLARIHYGVAPLCGPALRAVFGTIDHLYG